MKKLLVLLSILVMSFSLSACMTATTQQAATLTIEEGKAETSAEDYEKNLDGLVDYMEDNQLIAGDGKEMAADLIGATEGLKFFYATETAQFSCELYEYDLENLTDIGTQTIDSIKENGSFMSLGNEISAVINEKFVMVFSTVSGEDLTFTDKVNDKFNEFK